MSQINENECKFTDEQKRNNIPKNIYRKIYGAPFEVGKHPPMAEYEIYCDGKLHMYKMIDSLPEYPDTFCKPCPLRNIEKTIKNVTDQAPVGTQIWGTKIDEVMVKNDCLYVNQKETTFNDFDDLLIRQPWKIINIPKRNFKVSTKTIKDDMDIALTLFYRFKSENKIPDKYCKIKNIINLYREYVEIITENKNLGLEEYIKNFKYCFIYIDNAIPDDRSVLKEICEMIGRISEKIIFFRLSREMIENFGNFVGIEDLDGLNFYNLRWWK